MVPDLTTCLLEGILIVKKSDKSPNVSRLVSSIGQDLLYHANNGQKENVEAYDVFIFDNIEDKLQSCNYRNM